MYLSRGTVPTTHNVMSYLPTIPVMEDLTWHTNVLINSDLSERREAWYSSPQVNVMYSYVLNRNLTENVLHNMIRDDFGALWMLPYLPHTTVAREDAGVYLPSYVATYKYGEWALYWNREYLAYRRIDPETYIPVDAEPSSWHRLKQLTPIWIAPCWEAYVDRSINYTDVGDCRDGDTIKLKFRLTDQSEQAMVYNLLPPFDISDWLITPYQVSSARNLTKIDRRLTVSHSYRPSARSPDTTDRISAQYLLRYDDEYRDDFLFRGAFYWAKGGLIASNFVGDNNFWRLDGDKIEIEYKQGYAIAKLALRQTI